MSKERPFEGITPVPNIKVGYFEKEAYLKIIDNQAKQIDSFAYQIMALQSRIDILEKSKRPQGEWIPVKYRPMIVDERKAFAEHYGIEYCDTVDEKAFDCPLPEDGQEILVSTTWGVRMDVADNDIDGDGFICYGLEENGDWEGVDAWMPLPKPYEEAENDNRN